MKSRDRPQAPHLLLSVFAHGLRDLLYGRVYFAGDPLLSARCPHA
jgi:protocatechuate 3,4-dioxygenase beta subunit